MKKISAKDILVPTIALVVICLVATFLLGYTNMITQEKISQNEVEKEKSSRMVVLPEASSFGEVTALDNGITYCVATNASGAEVGYVFTTGAKGYGGTVSVMVGIDNNGSIKGIEILSHSETPGLGANATSDSFKSRFEGKSGELTVNKNSNDGQNIQAITAATITSKAVVSAVNMATEAFNEITGGGNNG